MRPTLITVYFLLPLIACASTHLPRQHQRQHHQHQPASDLKQAANNDDTDLASGTSTAQPEEGFQGKMDGKSIPGSGSSSKRTSGGSSPSPAPNATTKNPGTSSPGGRKGAGLLACPGIGAAVNSLNITWDYGWIEDPDTVFTDEQAAVPPNLDLVPLIQRTSGATTAAFNAIRSNPSYTTILGPNEPDINEKDPHATAAIWPLFVATGLRIGSPAPAHTTLQAGDWFVEFMSAVAAAGSRVDFIALHSYGQRFNDTGADVAGSVAEIKSYVEAVHARYGLPIWLTETAMARWDTPDCYADGCYPDEDTQTQFATALVQMLEGLDVGVLERYAYFEVGGTAPSNLIDNESGALNAAGRAYAAA